MIEQDIKRLEEIAKAIEKGANLDESLKLYEEGCKLAQNCRFCSRNARKCNFSW